MVPMGRKGSDAEVGQWRTTHRSCHVISQYGSNMSRHKNPQGRQRSDNWRQALDKFVGRIVDAIIQIGFCQAPRMHPCVFE